MEITTCSLSKASKADPKRNGNVKSFCQRELWQTGKKLKPREFGVFPQKSVTLVDKTACFASASFLWWWSNLPDVSTCKNWIPLLVSTKWFEQTPKKKLSKKRQSFKSKPQLCHPSQLAPLQRPPKIRHNSLKKSDHGTSIWCEFNGKPIMFYKFWFLTSTGTSSSKANSMTSRSKSPSRLTNKMVNNFEKTTTLWPREVWIHWALPKHWKMEV